MMRASFEEEIREHTQRNFPSTIQRWFYLPVMSPEQGNQDDAQE